MDEIIEFADREEFRKWLYDHCLSNDGVWLLFGKTGGPKTIKAGEALEEALCFGWIEPADSGRIPCCQGCSRSWKNFTQTAVVWQRMRAWIIAYCNLSEGCV